MYKINKKISDRILTIGPNYIDYKGGIGAVLYIYSLSFSSFKNIITLKKTSIFNRISTYTFAILSFIYKMIFDKEIRIIHLHSSSDGSFYRKYIFFLLGKYIFRKKIVFHIHSGRFDSFYSKSNSFKKHQIERAINKSDCVIAVSESWKDYFNLVFSPQKCIVIPNIVDLPKGNKIRYNNGKINFLFLGLISETKGIFDLMQLLINSKDKYRKQIQLKIGGNGKSEELKSIIIENKLDDFVEYLGWVDGERKIQELLNSDVFILPSYGEGLPISILEAMAYENAIIASNVGGIPEIVIPEKNGILITPGVYKEMEDAIDFFIQNSSTISLYAKQSKQMATKHLPDSVMKDLTFIYHYLLFN